MRLLPFRWFYMQILYLLIPMSVVLIVAAVLAFSSSTTSNRPA